MDVFLKRGLKLRHLQLLVTLQETGQLGQAAEVLGEATPEMRSRFHLGTRLRIARARGHLAPRQLRRTQA